MSRQGNGLKAYSVAPRRASSTYHVLKADDFIALEKAGEVKLASRHRRKLDELMLRHRVFKTIGTFWPNAPVGC